MRFVDYISKYLISVTVVISLLYCTYLFQFPDNFKMSIIVTFLLAAVLYLLTKDLFISLFISFLLSSQFFLPAKNYPFEYASRWEYAYELLPKGIVESIAINISDILGIFLILYFIRNKIVELFAKTTLIKQSKFRSHLKSKPIVISLASWIFYIILTLYSSIYYSFYPAFSINLTAQYGKMLIMFLCVIYLFSVKKRFIKLFNVTLLSMLLFQAFIGFLKFTANIKTGWVDYASIIDVEQKTNFFRIGGAIGDSNAYALFLALLLTATLPFVLKQKRKHWWIISVTSVISIILSQSRTIWFAMILVSLFLIMRYRAMIKTIIVKNVTIKSFYILFLGALLCIIIILPRLQASGMFFSSNGGGQLRLTMFKEGWLLLQQAPLSGFGAGTVVRALLTNYNNGYIATFPFTVHFAPLHIALESGIPAAIAFFIPFYLILRMWFQASTKRGNINIASTCSLCGIIIILISYILQPTYGRQDYMNIGLIIGIGCITIYSNVNTDKQYENGTKT